MNWLDELELDDLSNVIKSEELAIERFKITEISSLNWTLRKLSSLENKRIEEAKLANEEHERIDMWFAKQDATYQESRNFLEGLIKEFAKYQRAIDPKWKQKTPYGLVSFRKSKKFDYGDEENLVKYLNDNGMGEYVKVVETPKKAELKKALTITKDGKAIFTSTGEILPDVTAEEIEDVTIKLEG